MATATGASSADRDAECSVCHELFKNPKLLPCAHVLCRHCLLSWLASNPEALCPLCRGAIADPKEKSKTKGWEEVVDALPDDVAMAALVESTRVLSQDHVCVVCQSAAVSTCLTCNDMMCKPCGQAHTKYSMARDHKVADLSSMTAEELAASQPDHCSVHTSKPCELFCPTHRVAICHLCASAKHRACPDLTELAEAADKSREELSQMVTSLLTEEQQLEEAVAALERHVEATEKAMQEAVAEIDRTCDKLENSVKDCRRRLKEMTLDAKAKVKDTVLAVKVILLDHRGRLTSHRRVADRTTRGSTNKVLCDVARALRDRVKDILVTCGQRRADFKSVSMVTLTIDAAAVACIERVLSALGQVKVTPVSISIRQQQDWRFHTNHGKNIVLSNDGLTAERVKGLDNGIVIADQPMVPDVLYEIQLDEVVKIIGAYLPCGVVLTDPDHLRLPAAYTGWGSEAVVISHAVFNRGHRENNNLNDATRNLSAGSRVGVMVTTKAELHLWVNGSDRGVIATTVPTPCFAFFDLYYWYKQASVLPPRHHGGDTLRRKNVPRRLLRPILYPGHRRGVWQLDWRFHTNHGENIVLSNDGLTAERVKDNYNGIVVADQPMVPDVLYEVQLDKVDELWPTWLPCGVVLTDPDHLRLPGTALTGWGRMTVVTRHAAGVHNLGDEDDKNLNKATFDLPEGTRVGVMVTTKAELHLWVNGSDRGVIDTTVPTPCFAFFDLYFSYKKVSVLPPRHVY